MERSSLKKVAFFTTHLPPDDHFGGVVASGHALLAAHARAGLDVTAFCVGRDAAAPPLMPNVRLHKCPSRFLHRWGWAPGLRSRISTELDPPDIAYVNGILTYPATLAARRMSALGIPFVAATRGGMRKQAQTRGRTRKRVFFKLWTIPALSCAACLHATSPEEALDYRLFGLNRPVTIIPNGIYPERYLLPPDLPPIDTIYPALKDRRLVLFVGRISPEKGLDRLLRAWKSLGRKTADSLLAIVGPDDRGYLARLRSLAESLALRNVLFTGMLRGFRKVAMYRRADVFVLPSLTENFGNVVLEALVCGVPVIATRGTPWRMLVEVGAGLWVSPQPRPLADALRTMLNLHPTERLAMGRRGRHAVLREYTWDIVARKLMTVYQHVLAGEPPPLHPEPQTPADVIPSTAGPKSPRAVLVGHPHDH